MELYGYISGVEGNMYYVSQGKNKKLYLKGETINDLDSQELVWKIYETVNGKYNGTYYVEWDAFIGGSKNIVGKYTNTKGKTFKVNLKCTSTSSAIQKKEEKKDILVFPLPLSYNYQKLVIVALKFCTAFVTQIEQWVEIQGGV